MHESLHIRTARGSDRSRRLPQALDPDYFLIDEMSFEELVSLSAEVAGSLKYVTADTLEKGTGTWAEFLASNEVVIMAMIISSDPKSLRQKLRKIDHSGFEDAARFALDLSTKVNTWFIQLSRSGSAPAERVATELEHKIRDYVVPLFRAFCDLVESHNERSKSEIKLDLQLFDSIWLGEPISSTDSILAEDISLFGVLDAQPVVHDVSEALITVIAKLRHICTQQLPKAMQTGNHDPAAGLLLTFLRLFRHAQGEINQFTRKHLDYYYKDVLHSRDRPRTMETTTLVCNIATGDDQVVIPRGTEFTCGKDEELRDIVFRSQEKLAVTDATVTSLRTLRLERNRLIAPACNTNFVTRISTAEVPILQDAELAKQQSSWPVFGGSAVSRQQDDKDVSMYHSGLLIAAEILSLNEGSRTVELALSLKHGSKPVSSLIDDTHEATTRTAFLEKLDELVLRSIEESDTRHSDANGYQEDFKRLKTIIDEGENPQSIEDEQLEKLSRIWEKAERIDSKSQEHDHNSLANAGGCQREFKEALTLLADIENKELRFNYLVSGLKRCSSALAFKHRLGLLVVDFLLKEVIPAKSLRDEEEFVELYDRAEFLNCGDSLRQVVNELEKDRDSALKEFLRKEFLVGLSTESGWLEFQNYGVEALRDHRGQAMPGFRITLSLSPSDPSIVGCIPAVHGDQLDTELPLLKLTTRSLTSRSAYSLFSEYVISEINVNVKVSGARNIVAFNDISQLDPSKPFYPFGPLPTTNSYFAFAVPETIRKQVDSLSIDLEWGNLPAVAGGFAAHYEGYDTEYDNDAFLASVKVLNGGLWNPESEEKAQIVQLFRAEGKELRLQSRTKIEIDSIEFAQPDYGLDAEKLDLGLTTRNGFFKLTLNEPAAAFGHGEYPNLLSDALTANAKLKKALRRKPPSLPYTPLLNSVSVDYTASAQVFISASANSGPVQGHAKVFRINMFGMEQISPTRIGRAWHLYQPRENDGNLLIGISATAKPDKLSLYFSLIDDCQRQSSAVKPQIDWHYLSASTWNPLSATRLINDSTHGLLESGVVSLDLPDDIQLRKLGGSEPKYWIRVSSDAQSELFCSLRKVQTNALMLERSADDVAEFDAATPDRDSLSWQPVISVPGLGNVTQVDGFSNSSATESREQLIARMHERLRHRYRAVSPWDYERLILEEFPVVGKVKCFPNIGGPKFDYLPGHLLIVVVPQRGVLTPTSSDVPSVSAAYLNRIREFVSELNSEFAEVEVRNASNEWIQVRCMVVLAKSESGGGSIQRLNRDIFNFVNPWQRGGPGLSFDWKIKKNEVLSFIFQLPYVDYVTDFSMLHIVRDSAGGYQLGDTVAQSLKYTTEGDIHARFPFSIALPLTHQYIETLDSPIPVEAEVTGIRELEIGSTFIISGHQVDGETE